MTQAPQTAPHQEYISFTVANQLLGISVTQVQEILPHQSLTRVPQSNQAISGLLNLRGQIVTAIDLRKRLKLPDRSPDLPPMNVIVSEGGELFSLLIDQIGDVIPVSSHQFTNTPSTLDACWREVCEGVFRLKSGLLVILDVKKLLDFTGKQGGKHSVKNSEKQV